MRDLQIARVGADECCFCVEGIRINSSQTKRSRPAFLHRNSSVEYATTISPTIGGAVLLKRSCSIKGTTTQFDLVDNSINRTVGVGALKEGISTSHFQCAIIDFPSIE